MSKKQAQPRRSKYAALKAEHDAALETLSDGRLYEMTDETDEDGMPVFIEIPTSLSERADTAVASYTATIGLQEDEIEAWQNAGDQFFDMACRARSILQTSLPRLPDTDAVWQTDRDKAVEDLGDYIDWYNNRDKDIEDGEEE